MTGAMPALTGTMPFELALFAVMPFAIMFSQSISWLAYSQLLRDGNGGRTLEDLNALFEVKSVHIRSSQAYYSGMGATKCWPVSEKELDRNSQAVRAESCC
jgi:hypothetical protein